MSNVARRRHRWEVLPKTNSRVFRPQETFQQHVLGAAYTVSKHGILGLTRSTSAFYKNKGIRCNLVMPGGMNTSIVTDAQKNFAQATHAEGQKLIDAVVDALATPISDTSEVANLFAFLASTESSALNGAMITADKGITTVL